MIKAYACHTYYSRTPQLLGFTISTDTVFISEERLMKAPENYFREEKGNKVETIGWSPDTFIVSIVL